MATIEVYADVWCPFAHVSLRSVVQPAQRVGAHDLTLRVRAWPLELVNGVPLDPKVTAAHVAELRTQISPELFAGFDPGAFPGPLFPHWPWRPPPTVTT